MGLRVYGGQKLLGVHKHASRVQGFPLLYKQFKKNVFQKLSRVPMTIRIPCRGIINIDFLINIQGFFDYDAKCIFLFRTYVILHPVSQIFTGLLPKSQQPLVRSQHPPTAEVSAIAELRIAHWQIRKPCVIAFCSLRKQSCGIVYCGPGKHAAQPTSAFFNSLGCKTWESKNDLQTPHYNKEIRGYKGRNTTLKLVRTVCLNEVSIVRSCTLEHIGAVVKVPGRRRSRFLKQDKFFNRKDYDCF